MKIAVIQVSGVYAQTVWKQDIPAGIIGGQVEIHYTDPRWDGLTKTVVFRGDATKDVLNAGDLVTIPAEVVSRVGTVVSVGVYGTDAENNIVIPTIWACLGRTRSAADPSGDPSTDPALPVWAQIQEMIGAVDEAAVQKIVDDYLAANPPVGNVALNQGKENAGKLLYVGADGNVTVLALGSGLAIVDGVLMVTSAVVTAAICGSAVCSDTTICGGN